MTPTQFYDQTVLILNNPSKHSPKRFEDHQGMFFIIRFRRTSVLAVVFSSPLLHGCHSQPVLDCECMNSDLYWCKRSCSSCPVVFGSFVTSWMSRQCTFGGMSEGRRIWEGLLLCAEFFNLEIMPLTVVLCGVQEPLKQLCNLIQTDII